MLYQLLLVGQMLPCDSHMETGIGDELERLPADSSVEGTNGSVGIIFASHSTVSAQFEPARKNRLLDFSKSKE